MVRTYGPWCIVILLVCAGVPAMAVPTGAAPCTQPADPLLVTQNDADSGDDAPGTRDDALVLPEQDTIAGALQLPGGTVDSSDWYALHVGSHHESVMVELDPYLENALIEWGELVVVDAVSPQGDVVVTVPMGDEQVTMPAEEGLWRFQVRFVLDTGCHEAVGLIKLDATVTDYYLYVGCDPVCMEGT